MLNESAIPELNDDVRYRSVMGEGVILRQSAAEVVVVNEMGARILGEIDGRRTVGEIINGLLDEFEVERPAVRDDVIGYLDQLEQSGVIAEAGHE